jgi:hypothetical protein
MTGPELEELSKLNSNCMITKAGEDDYKEPIFGYT